MMVVRCRVGWARARVAWWSASGGLSDYRVAGPGRGDLRAGGGAGGGAERAERGTGAAGGGGHRQDGAAGVCCGWGRGYAAGPGGRGPGGNGDGVRWAAPSAGAVFGRAGAAAWAAAPGAGVGVRAGGRTAAGSVLVGLAALTLLTDAAAARPVLCLVDDAQWLDQVSVEVLGFIARRLYADRVGMVFTLREGEDRAAALAGLPELMLSGLPEEAAGQLLAASAGTRVDGRVSARIAADVAGNPLALVELAGELTAGELSG